MTGRRLRVVPVDTKLLMQMFGGHPMGALTSDWPADARLVNAQWNHNYIDRFDLLIESGSFDEVPDGMIPPDWSPTFHIEYPETHEFTRLVAALHADAVEKGLT